MRATLLALSASAARGASWLYAHDGETVASPGAQAATWGGLCTAGQEQSPIDINTTQVRKVFVLPTITTQLTPNLQLLKNSGHGFQLFETSPYEPAHDDAESDVDELGSVKGYSIIGGARFNFYQVHWHTPSENTIDGRSFPLEAHFVHQLDDQALVGTYHRLAVIALMYELGECDAFLDQFWAEFPQSKGTKAWSGGDVDFNAQLMDELRQGYYHWYGSLTTPPCTEGVSWNLLKVRRTVCQRQIDTLASALSNTQHGVAFNNRVVQPLYHRIVTVSAFAPHHWLYGYEGDFQASQSAQDETWDGLCVTGKEQSPINIISAEVQTTNVLPSISTNITAQLKYLRNSGHGFQLFDTSPQEPEDNTTSSGMDEVDVLGTSKGYSMIGGSKFNFYQVHWHTPSENTIDGRSFPLEAHFVHQFNDPSLVGTYHRLAVVALLYTLGDCNPFLDHFWSQFPSMKGMGAYTGPAIDLDQVLQDELSHGYYHWYGSLTTPPCTEGVSWNLLRVTETVCQRQIDTLKAALRNTQEGLTFNNRVVQPLNRRVVTIVGDGVPSQMASPAGAGASQAFLAATESDSASESPLGIALGILAGLVIGGMAGYILRRMQVPPPPAKADRQPLSTPSNGHSKGDAMIVGSPEARAGLDVASVQIELKPPARGPPVEAGPDRTVHRCQASFLCGRE